MVVQARRRLSIASGPERVLRAQSLANWYAILHSRNARLKSFKQRHALNCTWPQEVVVSFVRSLRHTEGRSGRQFPIPIAPSADA